MNDPDFDSEETSRDPVKPLDVLTYTIIGFLCLIIFIVGMNKIDVIDRGPHLGDRIFFSQKAVENFNVTKVKFDVQAYDENSILSNKIDKKSCALDSHEMSMSGGTLLVLKRFYTPKDSWVMQWNGGSSSSDAVGCKSGSVFELSLGQISLLKQSAGFQNNQILQMPTLLSELQDNTIN